MVQQGTSCSVLGQIQTTCFFRCTQYQMPHEYPHAVILLLLLEIPPPGSLLADISVSYPSYDGSGIGGSQTYYGWELLHRPEAHRYWRMSSSPPLRPRKT